MPTPYDNKEFLNRKDCSRYLECLGLKLAPKTLANLAANNNGGDGPPFVRTRWSKVFYNRAEVEAWAKTQTVKVG